MSASANAGNESTSRGNVQDHETERTDRVDGLSSRHRSVTKYGAVATESGTWLPRLSIEVFLEDIRVARLRQRQHKEDARLLRTEVVRQYAADGLQR